MKGRVEIKVPIYPTESEEKVREAVLRIFPDAELRREGDMLLGEAEDIDTFLDIIKRHRIRDAAREFLLKRKSSGEYIFELNKQVATVGVVNFVEEPQPLGSILVFLVPESDEEFLSRLTPTFEEAEGED